MSSVFEVPQQLLLVLTLAASPLNTAPTTASGTFADPRTSTVTDEVRNVAETGRWGGAYRFSDEAWLRAVRGAGHLPQVAPLAARIFKTQSDRIYVPLKAERRRILALRRNPALAQAVARSYALTNSAALAPRIGRPATAGELYIAHLIGAKSAARLINLAARRPGANAAAAMASVALENTELFFDQRRAQTAGEIYRRLTRSSIDPHFQFAEWRQHERGDKAPAHGTMASLGWRVTVMASQ